MFFQAVENLQIQNQQNHQNQLHIQAIYTIYYVNPGKLFSLSLSLLISKMAIIKTCDYPLPKGFSQGSDETRPPKCYTNFEFQ